ncbi:hypothetical protein PO909_019410 [Leuciscus waleckii]
MWPRLLFLMWIEISIMSALHDGGLVTDQGIQAGDIPPGEQIHPVQGVKNAAARCCSAADEWSYLSCHEGSEGEVTAQLYLVSGADACTPLSFTREETERGGREKRILPHQALLQSLQSSSHFPSSCSPAALSAGFDTSICFSF